MTIHVDFAEARARLAELVAAVARGEEVVLVEPGQPEVRLVSASPVAPPVSIDEQEREAIAAKRRAAFGMWKDAFEGYDTSIEALKAARGDPEERFRRKFGSPD